MAIKKSELYSSLWAGCDELRGGMDASQYKDYVLVMLFIKYTSDKWAGQPYAPITIPEGASFADMVKLKGNKDIGGLINTQILAPLEEANHSPGYKAPRLCKNEKKYHLDQSWKALTLIKSCFVSAQADRCAGVFTQSGRLRPR